MQCGAPPTKKPSECCEGLEKFAKEEAFESCNTECSGRDMCCKGNCFAKNLGILKDGKFDKDTAMKALNAAFGNDSAWSAVRNQNMFIGSYEDKFG